MQTIPKRGRAREKGEKGIKKRGYRIYALAATRVHTCNCNRPIGRFTRNYAICTRDVWKCTFSCASMKLQTRVRHSSSSFDDSAVAIGRRYFAYACVCVRLHPNYRPKCKYKMQSRVRAYAKQLDVTLCQPSEANSRRAIDTRSRRNAPSCRVRNSRISRARDETISSRRITKPWKDVTMYPSCSTAALRSSQIGILIFDLGLASPRLARLGRPAVDNYLLFSSAYPASISDLRDFLQTGRMT